MKIMVSVCLAGENCKYNSRKAGSDRAAVQKSQLRCKATVRRHIYRNTGGRRWCDGSASDGQRLQCCRCGGSVDEQTI